MLEVSGPKRKARVMDEAVSTAFAFNVLKEKLTTEDLILEQCVQYSLEGAVLTGVVVLTGGSCIHWGSSTHWREQ